MSIRGYFYQTTLLSPISSKMSFRKSLKKPKQEQLEGHANYFFLNILQTHLHHISINYSGKHGFYDPCILSQDVANITDLDMGNFSVANIDHFKVRW